MLANSLHSLIASTAEGFESTQKHKDPEFSIPKAWIDMVVFIMLLILVTFFGQVLWNNVLAGADKGRGFITILKPLPSLTDAVLMFFALSLFLN